MSRRLAPLLITVLLSACRYSSSETPPPVQPDFERIRAESPASTAAGGAAGDRAVEGTGEAPPSRAGAGAR